jgi:hypothetical protein
VVGCTVLEVDASEGTARRVLWVCADVRAASYRLQAQEGLINVV